MTRIIDPVLEGLRARVLRMGSLAEAILGKALRALLEGDAALAEEVRGDDVAIDRLDVEIDEEVLRVLATHAPVADDLREVIAIKMMATDLERVGDLARNVAQSALRLAEGPPAQLPPGLRALGEASRHMLRDALDSFGDRDARRARRVLDADDRLDADENEVIRAALLEIARHPAEGSRAVDCILVAKHLERVGDHATNIAEGVILAATARNVKHAEKLSGA